MGLFLCNKIASPDPEKGVMESGESRNLVCSACLGSGRAFVSESAFICSEGHLMGCMICFLV